ncbi:MAG: hypothetical protein HY505_00120 [Candidatus Yanofskybacteria bacterium]|nr:hypothetical protein [Candidatus Yanofskybacteria bacterium]
MIKKFLIKLTGWREKETNFSARTFKEKSAEESREAKERHQQIMEGRGDKKYVSERTAPSESEILGPSDSALKNEKEETFE